MESASTTTGVSLPGGVVKEERAEDEARAPRPAENSRPTRNRCTGSRRPVQRGVEVVGGGRRERIDRGAVRAHRGGEDAGDHQPREARGQVVHDEPGKELRRPACPRARVRRPRSPTRPAGRGELEHHHHARAHQRHPRVAQRSGRQQPLHDEVVGAVRGGGEQRAADDAAEQGVGAGEGDRRIDHPKLARLGRRGRATRPARRPGARRRTARRSRRRGRPTAAARRPRPPP